MRRLIGTVPAGVRLDAWPDTSPPEAPQDSPEVAQLREELRKSMPQMVGILETLDRLQQMRDLAGRLAGPQPAKMKLHRS
jgi:succinate dehydrogenase/fumarate reductase flavoprotein subunit